ncbi:MAG: integrase/recombinase XerC, partial [Saprospiraceae bacterium]
MVKPENWLNANGVYVREAGKGAPRNGKVINAFIRSFIARAENILLEAQMQNQSVSFSEFKAKIVNSNNQDFLQFFDEEIKRRTQANFAETSITTYQSEYNKLKLYRNRIDFVDLSPAFLEAYQDYLTEELGNKQNTVFRAMKTIKTILNVARKKKITDVYPFDNFKFTYQKDTRAQLNLTELERLQNHYDKQTLPKHLQNVLKYFLFACYTGLSFADLEALDYSCIYENAGELFIKGKRKKTDSAFLVPLLRNAKELIDVKRKEGIVFPKML